MKNKRIVRDIPNKWTKKSTFFLAIVILGLVAFFMLISVIPEYFRNNKLKKYEGKAFGLVLSIKETQTQTQGFEGSKTLTPYYTVAFVYKVNGKLYGNSNNIPNKGKYKKFIREIYDYEFKKEVIIKYMLINPKESLVKIE